MDYTYWERCYTDRDETLLFDVLIFSAASRYAWKHTLSTDNESIDVSLVSMSPLSLYPDDVYMQMLYLTSMLAEYNITPSGTIIIDTIHIQNAAA